MSSFAEVLLLSAGGGISSSAGLGLLLKVGGVYLRVVEDWVLLEEAVLFRLASELGFTDIRGGWEVPMRPLEGGGSWLRGAGGVS